MTDESLPWPKKGDRLFKPDPDEWWLNALLGWRWENLYSYACAYLHAAEVLIEHVRKTGEPKDTLVVPIAFLYRQFIELELKGIIEDGNRLMDKLEHAPIHHNIADLWAQCRRIIEKVWPDSPTDDTDAVEECIHEISKVDPASTAFRYPTDVHGKPSFPAEKYANLTNLSETMEAISLYLIGAASGISDLLDHKWSS